MCTFYLSLLVNRFTTATLALLASLFLTVPVLHAQYFGRNQVNYEDFDYKVLTTDNFEIYHYPAESLAVRDLGVMAERWNLRHRQAFNYSLRARNPMVIYANQADFQQNNIVPRVSVATGGVTEGLRNRVVLPFAETNQATNHVLGHELVHAFQYDLAKSGRVGTLRNMTRAPLWFIEGMAEYLSVGPTGSHTAMWMRDAVYHDDLPEIKEIARNRKYFPYRYGHSIWAYVTGIYGDEIIDDLYTDAAKVGYKKGFKSALTISVDSVSTLWRNSILEKYENLEQKYEKPSSFARPLITDSTSGGRLNIAPSVSPDGKYVAFISEKGLFSLDVFVARTSDGKIQRKLTSSLSNPHLRALRFIQSAGSWSPDSKKLALVIFADGDNEILIIDAKTGDTERTIELASSTAALTPAWSPDGTKLVYSGSSGGFNDLFIYNLENDQVTQLTDDKYSDLQPQWSPDGSEVVFITDRGSHTNMEEHVYGRMRLATYQFDAGQVELLPRFEGAKHINPHYGPAGNSIFYISDRGGVNDVYRYDIVEDQNYRITNVITGISGIGQLSPALTVARDEGTILMTVFEETNYNIYELREDRLLGTRVVGENPDEEVDKLPPFTQGGNQMLRDFMQTPVTDVTRDTSFAHRDYDPNLELTYIGGGAGVGVSTGYQGAVAAGGINMRFNDILKQHTLAATIRAQGRIQDIGGAITYLNQGQRFFWGGTFSHFPFRTLGGSAVVQDTVSVDGEPVVVPAVTRIQQRIISDRLAAIGIYPFNQNQRLEFTAGVERISYDYEVVKDFVNPVTGRVFDRERIDASDADIVDITEPDPLNLASATAAIVEDFSFFGITGPITGRRARLEVEPTIGTINFLRVLADYRKYWFAKPFTFAVRGLHRARYFGDSEDRRLRDNFLGYQTLIRGYNVGSFGTDECSQISTTNNNACPEFPRNGH